MNVSYIILNGNRISISHINAISPTLIDHIKYVAEINECIIMYDVCPGAMDGFINYLCNGNNAFIVYYDDNEKYDLYKMLVFFGLTRATVIFRELIRMSFVNDLKRSYEPVCEKTQELFELIGLERQRVFV